MHSPRMKSVLRTSVSDYADAEQRVVEETSAQEKRVNDQLAPLVSPRGKPKERNAESWPRDGREMAERWPRGGREMVSIMPAGSQLDACREPA